MTRVVCAVFVEDGRALACRRPLDKSEGGKWEFPGGKVEEGESDPKALEREIFEELQMVARVGEILGTSEGGDLTLVAYLCDCPPGGWELKEHLDARWVGEVEGNELDWAPLDLPLWRKVAPLLRE